MLPLLARVLGQAVPVLHKPAHLGYLYQAYCRHKQCSFDAEQLFQPLLLHKAWPWHCQENILQHSVLQHSTGQLTCTTGQCLAPKQVECFGTRLGPTRHFSASAATQVKALDAHLRRGRTQSKMAPECADYRSAIRSRISVLAQPAALLYDGHTRLVGTYKISKTRWVFSLGVGRYPPRAQRHWQQQYWLQLKTQVEAAVAHDLSKCALYGPEYSVNFPPDLYSEGDIAIMKEALSVECKDVFTMALATSTSQPPPTYQTRAAGRAAGEAVKTAIMAAALTDSDLQQHRPRGCRQETGNSFSASARETVTSVPTQHEESRCIQHLRSYATWLEAAVASDMMRQALDRPPMNFPAEVTAAGVPAMKKWLEHNRHRLTVEKQYWKEKAAAQPDNNGSQSPTTI